MSCGNEAVHAFTAYETDGPEFVCNIHDNDYGGPKGFWPHDVCCVAVRALWNQS